MEIILLQLQNHEPEKELDADLIIEIKIFVRNILVRTIEKYFQARNQQSERIRCSFSELMQLATIFSFEISSNTLKSQRNTGTTASLFAVTNYGRISAENYDNEFVDSFIWIDKTKFFRTSGWTYTIRKLNKIHSSGYDVLVDPNEIKSQLSEYIKKHSGAGIIIENSPVFLSNLPEKLEILTRRSNNKPRAPLCEYFQFNANKKFIEELIESRIYLTKTSIEIEHLTNPEDYIVLFPGAGTLDRVWSSGRFSDLCILLRKITPSKILICGDSRDRASANDIVKFSGIENIEDITGKTTLPQLVKLIGRSKLLISNESCAVHIAAAVGTKAVCISNGNHFGKFNPYPKSMAENIETLYPAEVNDHIDDYEVLIRRFAISSDIEINKISVESVFEVARNLLD